MENKYVIPEVEVIEVAVEKGYANSGDNNEEIGIGGEPGAPD